MEDIGLEYGFVTDREELLIERGIDPEEERARRRAQREAAEAKQKNENDEEENKNNTDDVGGE